MNHLIALIKDKIARFIAKHIKPVPPEEQMPSRYGLFSGWSFRFSENEKTILLLLLLIIVAAILVVGTVTALTSAQ